MRNVKHLINELKVRYAQFIKIQYMNLLIMLFLNFFKIIVTILLIHIDFIFL